MRIQTVASWLPGARIQLRERLAGLPANADKSRAEGRGASALLGAKVNNILARHRAHVASESSAAMPWTEVMKSFGVRVKSPSENAEPAKP